MAGVATIFSETLGSKPWKRAIGEGDAGSSAPAIGAVAATSVDTGLKPRATAPGVGSADGEAAGASPDTGLKPRATAPGVGPADGEAAGASPDTGLKPRATAPGDGAAPGAAAARGEAVAVGAD